jgi:hypothetical protein
MRGMILSEEREREKKKKGRHCREKGEHFVCLVYLLGSAGQSRGGVSQVLQHGTVFVLHVSQPSVTVGLATAATGMDLLDPLFMSILETCWIRDTKSLPHSKVVEDGLYLFEYPIEESNCR